MLSLTVSAGSGLTINVDPAISTRYYVRAEGDCNDSDTVQAWVSVSQPSPILRG